MDNLRKYWRELALGVLIVSNILVWTAFIERRPSETLSVYFLDVGQGDAILIDSPQHKRILIDGGKNRKVLTEVGKILPFADRRIDTVIATHPDSDHIGGLPEVISRYNVGVFIESGVTSDNSIDDELHKRIGEKNIQKLLARRGMVVHLDDNVRLEILFPTQDVSNWETNRASIVSRLVYGEHEFLLTGDSPIAIENVLISMGKAGLDVDVLKAGHHGSRTSTSLEFAEATSPQYAIISASIDNTYGHPHKEVLDILNKVNAQILSTTELGTIKFETNGKILKLKQ
ncbi:MAG: ComEC/Rec2 family competence protein [Patescibacteria group bacterium]